MNGGNCNSSTDGSAIYIPYENGGCADDSDTTDKEEGKTTNERNNNLRNF